MDTLRPKKVTTHLARFIDARGNHSPWCFKRPRALKLTATTKVVAFAESNWRAVNCKRCRTAYAEAHPDRVEAISLKALRKFADENGIPL